MRPPRSVIFGRDARARLAAGIELVARLVAPTLGPSGRSAVLDSRFGTPEVSVSAVDRGFFYPTVARDGFAIASEILIDDPFVNQGIAVAREAARMTKRTVGDGSTTAIVLLRGLVRQGLRLVEAGHDPAAIEAGISTAVARVVAALRSSAVPIRAATLVQTAACGANDRELGETIAAALEDFGESGVLIERGGAQPVELEIREGLRLDRGAVSPFFLDDEARTQSILRDCYVLALDGNASSARELAPVLSLVAREQRPLLVVAHGFEADALATLTVNRLNRKVDVVAVVAPSYGQQRRALLEDVALLTGGLLAGNGSGVRLETLTLADLGEAREVTVTRKSTTIVAGGGERPDALRARAALAEVEHAEAASVHDREVAARRRAELSDRRFAVVLVGGSTDVERDERLRRAEDGLRAALAGRRGGVVAGGGAALARAGRDVDLDGLASEHRPGATIVRSALADPLRTIAANAGADGSAVVARVLGRKGSAGFDAEKLLYTDVERAGILDPAEVLCAALESASYCARRVLLSEAVVAQPLSGGRLLETAELGGPANLPMP